MAVSEESGSTIIRNIYECFRMLGDALLVAKGIEAEDHMVPIQELIKLKVQTSRPLQLIDNLRRLRHDINYRGYCPSQAEVKDAISLAQSCFQPVVRQAEERVKRQ